MCWDATCTAVCGMLSMCHFSVFVTYQICHTGPCHLRVTHSSCRMPHFFCASTSSQLLHSDLLCRLFDACMQLCCLRSTLVRGGCLAAVWLPCSQRSHRQHCGSCRARHCARMRTVTQCSAGRRIHEGRQVGAQQVCGRFHCGQDAGRHGLW